MDVHGVRAVADEAAMRAWLDAVAGSDDPLFLTVIERATGDPSAS